MISKEGRNELIKLRLEQANEVYIQFSKEEVEQLFEDMKVFVTEIENHVLNDLS